MSTIATVLPSLGSVSPVKSVFPEMLWAGTEHSLEQAMAIHAQMQGAVFGRSEEKPELPDFLDIQGSIGVITIAGPLMPKGNWLTRLFGLTDYEGLREAAVHAAQDSNVKAILLDVSSGGGAVSGLFDTTDLLKKIDAEVKPVYTFAGGDMASAAYALGVTGRKIYASKTSVVGSIGVIATHKEYSKAMKEAGIGVTVIRAGEFKALANQFEPLSDKALAQVQAQLDASYEVFLEHVAVSLGMTTAYADKHVAQGREFVGAQAVDAKLVDGIDSFDGVMSRISATLLDNSKMTLSNTGNRANGSDMTKKALTEQDIAALAAGAAAEAAATGTEVVAKVEKPAAELEKPAAEVTKPPEEKDDGAVLAFVKGQLTEAQSQVLDLTMANKGLQSQVDAMKAGHDNLLAIAVQSLSNMRVALGQSAVDGKSMSADVVLVEHAKAVEAFNKSFKAGGVAAAGAPSAATAKEPDANHLARVKATRLI